MFNKTIDLTKTIKKIFNKKTPSFKDLEEQKRIYEEAVAAAEAEEIEYNSKKNIIQRYRQTKNDILKVVAQSNLNKKAKDIAIKIINDLDNFEFKDHNYYRILAQITKDTRQNNEYNQWLSKSITNQDEHFCKIDMPKDSLLEKKLVKYGLHIFPTEFQYPKQKPLCNVNFNIDKDYYIDYKKNMFYYLLNLLPDKFKNIEIEIKINEKLEDVKAHVIQNEIIEFACARYMTEDVFCHELGHVFEKHCNSTIKKLASLFKINKGNASFNNKLKNTIKYLPTLISESSTLFLWTFMLATAPFEYLKISNSPFLNSPGIILGSLSLVNYFLKFLSDKNKEKSLAFKHKHLYKICQFYDLLIYRLKNYLKKFFRETTPIDTKYFPSEYAKTNERELFSELIEAYLLYGDAMRVIPKDSLVYQAYEILKEEVFEGIEYTRNEYKMPIILNQENLINPKHFPLSFHHNRLAKLALKPN